MAHLDGSLNQAPAGRLHVGVIERAQAACQQGYCRGDPSRQARVQRSLVTSDSGGVAAYRRILRQTLVQDLASSLRTRRTIEEPTAARQPARGDPLCTARRSGPGRGPAGDRCPGPRWAQEKTWPERPVLGPLGLAGGTVLCGGRRSARARTSRPGRRGRQR